MRGVNKVILVGRLGRDPETKYSANGSAITTLSVATSEQWTDKNTGQKQEKTEWHRVVMFGKLAEIAGQYLRKGSNVYLEGKLQTRKWQDQNTGQDRYSTEVVIDFNGQMQMLDGGNRQGGDVPFDDGFNQAPAAGMMGGGMNAGQGFGAQPNQNAGFGQNTQGGFGQQPVQNQQAPQQQAGGFGQTQQAAQQPTQQTTPQPAAQPAPAFAPNDFDDDDVPF